MISLPIEQCKENAPSGTVWPESYNADWIGVALFLDLVLNALILLLCSQPHCAQDGCHGSSLGLSFTSNGKGKKLFLRISMVISLLLLGIKWGLCFLLNQSLPKAIRCKGCIGPGHISCPTAGCGVKTKSKNGERTVFTGMSNQGHKLYNRNDQSEAWFSL